MPDTDHKKLGDGHDDQVRDSAAPWVDPIGGEAPHLEEPPEVEALLAVVRPWQLLLVLAVASIWLPAVLAGYGKRLARADHAVAEARWAAEDAALLAANPPGDCDSYAILQSGNQHSNAANPDSSGALDRIQFLHVKFAVDRGTWVAVVDDESSENLARFWSGMPGTNPPGYTADRGYTYSGYSQDIDYRGFPSRVAATYQPGSVYYERFILQKRFVSLLQQAMECDTWPARVGSDRNTVREIRWWRYDQVLYYVLNRAAFQRDWASFLRASDQVFVLGSHRPYDVSRSLCIVLGVIIEQHGAAMPPAVLQDLRSRLLALQQNVPDVDQEVAAWKREFLESYFDAMLGPQYWDDYWGGTFKEPIFLQRFAMFYPFRRGRVDRYGARLRAEMKAFLAAPGPQWSAFEIDGGIIVGLGGGRSIEAGAIGASAFSKSNSVEEMECYRQVALRLAIASLDALLLRAETGAWPASIAALGEPTLRVDPFSPTAAPLGLRVDATGALRVWSVSRGAVNGGGLFMGEAGYFADDIIQRVEPPVADQDSPADANQPAEVTP